MPLTPTITYSNAIVQPAMNAEDMLEMPVVLKVSTTYPAGTVIGEIMGTIDVQHLHASGALSAGTYTVSDGVNTSGVIQWNASAADVQAAFDAALPGPIIFIATGGTLTTPTNFDLTRRSSGVQATMTVTPTGVTGGTISVTHTATGSVPATNGTYGPYATGNSDGTQLPKGILRYPCVTDAAGNITIGGDYNVVYPTAPMAFAGIFRIQDLVGLDSGAVTAFPARILEGAVGSNGLIILPG